MTPIVHIVDDDPGFRDSLRSLLESDNLAVATYADPADFLERYLPDQPGCLLIDVRMPGLSGLQLQDELLRRGIRVPTIFITAHGDVAMAVAAVRKGALDFVEKPFDDESLIRRIRSALERDAAERDVKTRLAALSAREREVVERVVAGRTNKVIAKELGIAVKTVEFHRKRITDKLQVKTTADLIHLVVEHRLSPR
jgi:RNA polymerase sigma factor (sigma-70 family)